MKMGIYLEDKTNLNQSNFKIWGHEMKTVADIFQLACKLNKKQRKKMFKDFAQMNEVSVLYKKACDEMIEEDSKLEVEIFRWSK